MRNGVSTFQLYQNIVLLPPFLRNRTNGGTKLGLFGVTLAQFCQVISKTHIIGRGSYQWKFLRLSGPCKCCILSHDRAFFFLCVTLSTPLIFDIYQVHTTWFYTGQPEIEILLGCGTIDENIDKFVKEAAHGAAAGGGHH
jgi:hypothetical protein